MIEIIGGKASAQIFIDTVDESVITQLYAMLNSDVLAGSKIRIMPDTHAGKGSVIGFTGTIQDKICPNIVGVDIGCGIYSWNLGKIKPDLTKLDEFIHNEIPHGFKKREHKLKKYSELALQYIFKGNGLRELTNKIKIDYDQVLLAIGTLGGGNHFLELGESPTGDIWLTVHSGSRNFGLQVATYFQRAAKFYCADNNINVQRDLEYLPLDQGGNEYLEAMKIAQMFAHINRCEMANPILAHLFVVPQDVIESVHNYIDIPNKLIRKGAISAHQGERILIPFNMRDGIAVATGKGNDDWNQSSPHGAGRVSSRSKAKARLSLDEFKSDMEGIFTTCVSKNTLDEAPRAYKNMDIILKEIQPTADVDFLIKPIYNFKAA